MYNVLGTVHATSNFPLRGGKATNYDGGLRVPTAIIWPGLTQPNTLSNIPIQSADYFPTLLSGLNLSWPSPHIVDGNDIRPALQGKSIQTHAIFSYYPAEPRVPDWLPPSITVMLDGWKLIRTFHYGRTDGHFYQLYDLNTDPSESNNLYKVNRTKLAKLDELIDDHLLGSDAVSPAINPNYLNTFNYNKIGIASENFQLPEEKMQIDFQFQVDIPEQIIDGGSTAKITYQLTNATNRVSVRYEQFMGPSIELIENDNSISFIAPNVSQSQYVALAFIVSDGQQTIRKQVGVRINPTQVAPSLSVWQISKNVTKGSIAEFLIEATDGNKDFINMSVTSDDLTANSLSLPPAIGTFMVNIPIDLSGDSITLFFTAEDLQHSVQQTITFNVSGAIVPEIESTSGGSINALWLMFVGLFIVFRPRCWARRFH
ncbi:MAG: hypothetical protein ACJASB_003967 [Shewanella psychromarinicola]|jgi:hypothetical protein